MNNFPATTTAQTGPRLAGQPARITITTPLAPVAPLEIKQELATSRGAGRVEFTKMNATQRALAAHRHSAKHPWYRGLRNNKRFVDAENQQLSQSGGHAVAHQRLSGLSAGRPAGD